MTFFGPLFWCCCLDAVHRVRTQLSGMLLFFLQQRRAVAITHLRDYPAL